MPSATLRSTTSTGRRILLSLAVALLFHPALAAAPPDVAEAEIAYLLSHVERSGCEFYRNGRWYAPEKARAHLQQKYEFLVARNRIHTAEDFIELAGTSSSLTGRPYQVRCGGTESVPSREWLLTILRLYRSPPQG